MSENIAENITKKRGRPKKFEIKEAYNNIEPEEIPHVTEEEKMTEKNPILETLVKQQIKIDQLQKLFRCALKIIEM